MGSTNIAKNAKRNRALRTAGCLAIATAAYHGWSGDNILRSIEMSKDDLAFVTGTYQLGTMGWVAGGALLLGATKVTDRYARRLITTVTGALFAIPAFGTLVLTGGQISAGGLALATVVALTIYGRNIVEDGEPTAPAVEHLEMASTP